MATLKLTKLHCRRQQDVTGYDEVRILVNNYEAWSGPAKHDDWTYINTGDIEFVGICTVIAQEMNGTKAKQIGNPATVRESGNPDLLTFKTSGTWYELYYNVTE